ncbi:MAG: hypothetical protein AB7T63_10750 [Planctomycetota bacterium]
MHATTHGWGARRSLRLGLLFLVATMAAAPHGASAGGTEEVRVAGAAALGEGTFERALVDDDGVIRPGPAFESIDVGAATAWAALQQGDVTWIATGNDAQLKRVEGKDVKTIDLGPGLLVTAVAAASDGGVVAAVFPGARVMRVDVRGDDVSVTPLAALPVEHVWALAGDGQGGVVAATGGPAALYAVDGLGTVARRAALDDDHVRCLAPDGAAWLVGTAPKGLVARVAPDGAVAVLHDFEQQEIVGIVRRTDGSLLVAANADEAGGNAQAIGNLVKQMEGPPATPPGGKPAPRPGLQDGHVLHLEPSGVLTVLWQEKKVAVLGLTADGGGAVAGTGPGARLVRVEPGHAPGVLGDLPEAEASVVVSNGEGRLTAVVTSNPVVLHRRLAKLPEPPTWTSDVLDASAVARWGRLRVEGQGVRGLEVRGGPVDEPDASWSAWRKVTGGAPGVADTALDARFAQVRVTLDATEGEVRAITWVRQGPNRPPVLSAFEVNVPGAPKEGGPPSEASPKRELSWKVEDADGDDLITRIEIRRTGVTRWHVLVDDEELPKPAWSWDTSGWPDGLYDVKLTVSDAGGNDASRTRSVDAIVLAHRVDNTAPRVDVRLERDGEGTLVVRATATDAADGRIVRLRYSLDGQPWRVLAAEDGLFDEPEETAQARLPDAKAGAHDVVVQATDALGNVGAGAAVSR